MKDLKADSNYAQIKKLLEELKSRANNLNAAVPQPVGIKNKNIIRLEDLAQKLEKLLDNISMELDEREKNYEEIKNRVEAELESEKCENYNNKMIDSITNKLDIREIFNRMKGEDFFLTLEEVRDNITKLNELTKEERNFITQEERDFIIEKVQASGDDELSFSEFAALFEKEDQKINKFIIKSDEELEIDESIFNFKKRLSEKKDDLENFKKDIHTDKNLQLADAIIELKRKKKDIIKFESRFHQFINQMLDKRLDIVYKSLEDLTNKQKDMPDIEQNDREMQEALEEVKDKFKDAKKCFDQYKTDKKWTDHKFEFNDFDIKQDATNMFMEEMTLKAMNLNSVNIGQNNELFAEVKDAKLRNKIVLRLQAFFRARKARKYVNVLKTKSQKIRDLAQKWVKNFRKRAKAKVVCELVDYGYVNLLERTFYMIKNAKDPKYNAFTDKTKWDFLRESSLFDKFFIGPKPATQVQEHLYGNASEAEIQESAVIKNVKSSILDQKNNKSAVTQGKNFDESTVINKIDETLSQDGEPEKVDVDAQSIHLDDNQENPMFEVAEEEGGDQMLAGDQMLPTEKTVDNKQMDNIPIDPKLIWATIYLQKFWFKNHSKRDFSGNIQTAAGIKKLCEACKQNQIDIICRDCFMCLWCNKCFIKCHVGKRRKHVFVSINNDTREKIPKNLIEKISLSLKKDGYDLKKEIPNWDKDGNGTLGASTIKTEVENIDK